MFLPNSHTHTHTRRKDDSLRSPLHCFAVQLFCFFKFFSILFQNVFEHTPENGEIRRRLIEIEWKSQTVFYFSFFT